MPTYLILARFTDEGRRHVKDVPQQVRQAIQQAEQQGFKVHGWWLTMGPYDTVGVVDAPSDEAMAMGALAEGMQGGIETVTMRAFNLDEAERLVSQLPRPA
jgi:uncharacterized protein with GYD domain